MYEVNTITAAEHVPEKRSKYTKLKHTDNEKLRGCYEQRTRLLEQQKAAKKKGEEINKRISDTNAKIADLENKELIKICKEKKISTQELIGFLKKLPEGITLEDVAKTAFEKMPINYEQLQGKIKPVEFNGV